MTIARERLLDEISLKEARAVLAPARAGEALKKLKSIAVEEARAREVEARLFLTAERADGDEPGATIVVVLEALLDESTRWDLWRAVDDCFGAYLGEMTVSKRRAVNRSIGFKVVVDAGHVD